MDKNKCPFQSLIEPKGPKGAPLINSLPFLAWNPLQFFVATRKKYGDIATYKTFGKVSYLVSHPDDIATVFKQENQGTTYEKEFFHQALYDYFGNGLLNSYGNDWIEQRKQLKPYFQKSEHSKWLPIIVEETLLHFQSVPKDTSLNAKDIIKPLVQAIMCRVLFGIKPDDQSSKELINALDLVSERLISHSIGALFLNGILNKFPTPSNLRYKKALKTIEEKIIELSNDNNSKKQGGLVPLLSKNYSPKQLKDQLFTIFFAGQDSTANGVLWTLYHLAKYSEVQDKVRKEVNSLWSTINEASITNFEKVENNVDKMIYLNAVIDESMRLYPPVYGTYRDIKENTQLGLYTLKKNSLLILSMYVTHRHPDIWENPNEFNPERFINKKNNGFSFYPFSGGKRICLGVHLAKLEMTTILAFWVSHFKFELEPDYKVKKEIYVVLRPKNGLPLKITPLM